MPEFNKEQASSESNEMGRNRNSNLRGRWKPSRKNSGPKEVRSEENRPGEVDVQRIKEIKATEPISTEVEPVASVEANVAPVQPESQRREHSQSRERRPERRERTERAERPERRERSDRPERFEQRERSERPERRERDRFEHNERSHENRQRDRAVFSNETTCPTPVAKKKSLWDKILSFFCCPFSSNSCSCKVNPEQRHSHRSRPFHKRGDNNHRGFNRSR